MVAANDIASLRSLQFDFKSIETATSKFSDCNKLGKGGFGEVYKVCVCVCVLGSSQVDMIVLESYIHLLTIGFFQMLRFKIHLAIKYEFFDVIKRYLEKVNPVKIS